MKVKVFFNKNRFLLQYGPVSTVFRTDLMVNGKTNDMVFFMIKEKMHYECDASTGANHVMTIIGNLVANLFDDKNN